MNKQLKISFFASGIILFFGFYFFYPFGLPNVKNYFEPIGERALQKDEIRAPPIWTSLLLCRALFQFGHKRNFGAINSTFHTP